MTDIPDKAAGAAMRAFADKVIAQDESWIEVIADDGTSIVAPCGDYFALDLPMRAALAATQPHMGGEPVAWRYRWQEQGELGPVWSRGVVVSYDPTLILPGEFEVQPLYLAPPASPDVAALIEAAPVELPECCFNIGDAVEKVTGDYKFPGTVISVMRKLSGSIRYAVEDDRGAIHIFNAGQIALRSQPAR